MNALQQAMIAAGLASEAAPSPTAPTAKLAPCSDTTGKLAHYLVSVLGEAKATALLEAQLYAPYGRARREQAIYAALSGMEQSIPRSRLRSLEVVGDRGWGMKALNATMEEVLGALSDGSYSAWELATCTAITSGSTLVWPAPPDELTEASIAEYVSALYDWEGDYTPLQLKAAKYPGYPAIRDSLTAKMREIESQRHAEYVLGVYTRYTEGSIDLSEVNDMYVNPEVVQDILGISTSVTLRSLCASSPRGWEDFASWSHSPVAPPSKGWESLTDQALLQAICWPYQRENLLLLAIAELYRRNDMSVGQVYLTRDHVITRTEVSGNLSGKTGIFETSPHPSGWYASSRYKVAGPEVYEALQRVLAHKQGTLSVRDLMGAYGRHETKAFPRFRESAFRSTCCIIGIDPALGAYLDDLALVQSFDVEVPESAFWIDAHVTPTQAGGLYVKAGAREVSALVRLYSSCQSWGPRKGHSGEIVKISQKNKAPAIFAWGSSRGGGQEGALIFGVVTPGTPLLFDDGRGCRMVDRQVELLAGLETGLVK